MHQIGAWLSDARRLRLRQSIQCARRAAHAVVLGAIVAGAAPLAAEIVQAEYASPTPRYPHGVLGDAVEYGSLLIHVAESGTDASRSVITYEVRLPLSRVFEDLQPRLADVDGDGAPEVIVVESHVDKGAQLAIYDARGHKIAATPHIGTRFRWLAPIGAADLDGDGRVEIAYIDRPHLAKTLRIWRFQNNSLREVASAPGLTNHRIGEDVITSGIRDCGEGPELVTVSADWSRVMISAFSGGEIRSRDIAPFQPSLGLGPTLACEIP